MKKLYQARSACLILAMLLAFSWASAQIPAQSIVPCTMDTSSWPYVLTPISDNLYSQDGGTTVLQLSEPASLVFKIDNEDHKFDGADATDALSEIGGTFSAKTNQWESKNMILPAGNFEITAYKENQYMNFFTVTVKRIEPYKFEDRYYYELDGTEIAMEKSADGTWSFSLQEVIGTTEQNEDLSVTTLRLKKVNYNVSKDKIVPGSEEYLVPSMTGNRKLANNAAEEPGDTYAVPYTFSAENNVIIFEAARASYKVTVDPKGGKFTFTRLEYVAFPRYIYPNKPEDVTSVAFFTRIPNDVTKEDYVRYQKDTPIVFSVVMSSQGMLADYAPAADTELIPGATVTLVPDGQGKLTVGRSAKYRLAYSLDTNNNIVVSAADTQEVIETLEVWLTADGQEYCRALPLKVDPATGHFVGSIYNDTYSIALRTKDAEYNVFRYENYKDTSAPYRDFVFTTQMPANNSQDWKQGPYYSTNMFSNNQGYWLQFDAEERPDGDINLKMTRVDADTVPANAIYDDYFLVVTKQDGSETEVPMRYNGAYYAEHQTAAGEKYHFRGRTTSVLDGKEYVVNQYLGNGNAIYKDNAGNMLTTNCSGNTKYTFAFANAPKKYIYSAPTNYKGVPDAENGSYHKYIFNWYYFPMAESPANRRAILNDLDLVVLPDPVLDVRTSEGGYRKLIYNHLRYKNESALHLKAGEEVWVEQLDREGGEVVSYWSAGAEDITFEANSGKNIKLDDLDLFNPDVFKVYTMTKGNNHDCTFVAPEEGDYYVSVSVNRLDANDKKIKFTKAAFPDYIYLLLVDENPYDVDHDEEGNMLDMREAYFSHVVRIPQSPVTAGYYDTTNASLLEYTPGADGKRGTYAETTDLSRLDAEGNLAFYNGDRFYISDQCDRNNLIISSATKGCTGMAWGLIYGGYGSGKDIAIFRPGKNVRLYRGDMTFSGEGVNLDVQGNLIPADQFTTSVDEDGQTIYTDRHAYVFHLDLTSATDPTYSWGESMDYTGVDYALYGEYADRYYEKDADGYGKIPFVYHPQTGLYTLSLPNFYGAMRIASASGGMGDAAHTFLPTLGQGDITDTSVAFPLYNAYDLDGNPLRGEAPGDNFFILTEPDAAIGSVVSKVGDLGGRDVYLYENVTIVFDPYSHRLYVTTRVNEPENKDIDPGKKEEYPMYMVFVRARDDDDEFINKYRSWREWAEKNGAAAIKDLFDKGTLMTSPDFEASIEGKTDLEAIKAAEDEFATLTEPQQQVLVAEAKIEFFTKYFEIAGYRQMVPLRDNPMHYLSGEWDADELGNFGNGWIDSRCTNVADGESTTAAEPFDPAARKSLSGLRYQMYLTDASLIADGDKGMEADWELHNIIAYFFGEKEPVVGETLLQYMSKTVCYGSSDLNRTLRLGRQYLEPDEEGHDVIRIDPCSVGGRRATLFGDGEIANTEETPMSPNSLVTAIDLRKDEGKITMANQISRFTFFVMKVMRNSRIFAEMDNSTANIWSKVYRQDDKLYLVFNDVQDAIDKGEALIYQNTQPRYISMETVQKGETLNRIETPVDNLPYNYVMKPVSGTEILGEHQRDAYDKYAGDGFFRFSNNKIMTDDFAYFMISRKAVDDRGEEFDLHRVVTHSYNWLPLAYDETGNPDATRKITWGDFQKKKADGEIWWEPTPEAVLSAPLVINRTGYVNFLTKDFINRLEQGDVPTTPTPKDESDKPAAKAPVFAPRDNSPANVEANATGFLPTTNDAANVIDDHINDIYVESATSDTKKKDQSFVYRAHIVLKGGRTPVVNIKDASARSGIEDPGYTISYTGPVAKNDMIYLERAQINHVYTGVEDITVDTPASDTGFRALISVEGRRLTVSGASQVSVYTVSGIALATGASGFSRTVEPGVYIIVADGATAKVLVP